MRLLVVVACLLSASPVWGAISFDAASGGTKTAGSGTTLTISSFTATGTGTNGLMVVACAITTGGGTTISSVVWNTSESLTQLATFSNSNNLRIDIWYKKNPTATTANIVMTESADVQGTCHVATYTGVNQTTPFGTQQTASGDTPTAPSVTVTTATGEVVLDIVGAASGGDTNNLVVGANQTQRDITRCGAAACAGTAPKSGISEQAGADGGVMSWATTGMSTNWVQMAVPIKPVATRRAASSPVLFQ